jgi:alpha,alpha-trehalase
MQSRSISKFCHFHLKTVIVFATTVALALAVTTAGNSCAEAPLGASHEAPQAASADCARLVSAVVGLPLASIRPYAQTVSVHTQPSQALLSPLIAEARDLKLVDDFMALADLRAVNPSETQRRDSEERAQQLQHEAEQAALQSGKTQSEAAAAGRKAYLNTVLPIYFVPGEIELLPAAPELSQSRWQLGDGTSLQKRTVTYIENLWSKLVKRTPQHTHSSLIPLPFPVTIPGARFQVSYYWDSYFGNQALLRTGRWKLAAMQVENFLFMINTYGLVPNAPRDYYLSRSQPPLLSSMVREVYNRALKEGESPEVMKEWLRERVFPLVRRDYMQFWMNPETRYDATTGLNHHWDAENKPRDERHSADNEEEIAQTYRDVRAEAESGKDFTVAFEGRATRMAPVLLNAIMYKMERDLKWMANTIGRADEARLFTEAARRRRIAIDTYLWDSQQKAYFDYNLERRGRSRVLTADIYAMLWAKAASRAQAQGVRDHLKDLDSPGGLYSSNAESGKQWDKPYVWAPQQYFGIQGLIQYGYVQEGQHIATAFTSSVERIFAKTGAIYEKIDGRVGDLPIETGDKYLTQEGFLWTNGIYMWAMMDVLGHRLVPRAMVAPAVTTRHSVDSGI